MEPDRFMSRQVLFGELREGAQRVGQPLLHFKDVYKHNLQLAEIIPN